MHCGVVVPTELKIIIALNVIATVVLAVFTLGVGGGLVASVFPPNHSIELKMVMIAPTGAENKAAATPGVRPEIPPEYRTLDLSPSPWRFMPDGSVRFDQTERP